MASINKIPQSVKTHEGAKAKRITAEQALRRSVLSCLLWENEFYESGETIAKRIQSLVKDVSAETVAKLAIEARHEMKLRHAPLLLVAAMVKLPSHRHVVASTLNAIVNRPDELSEFLAIYWKDGKCPVANQVKKGLGDAFKKFNEYQLAKWNRASEIKLRDVMRICHPKPDSIEQAKLWKRLLNDELVTPDTHEVAMSAKGADKGAEWTRLIRDNKLGGMAVLKNLRRMENDGVDRSTIRKAIGQMNTEYVLPYRFISAAKYAPALEPDLEDSMIKCLNTATKMKGKTALLIDVSGSMSNIVSGKSEITRLDAACGLGILLREICEDIDIFTFSRKIVRVPSRRGFALRDAIINSQGHNATYLGTSVSAIYAPKGKELRIKGHYHGSLTFEGQGLNPDRLIVISDEQSHDPVPDPQGKGYMINVASSKHGVGYGAWTHCDGWSESVVRWIQELETEQF
jgi:hypothetical protein